MSSSLVRQSSLTRSSSLTLDHHVGATHAFRAAPRLPARRSSRAARLTRPRAQASEDLRASPFDGYSSKDPFKAAAVRLECLMNAQGDGQEEYVEQLVQEEGEEFKVMVSMLTGSIVLLGSFAVSAVFGCDPWGGMSLSAHSAGAGVLGLLAAAPLAGAKLWTWTPHGQRCLPAVKQLHDHQAKQCRPWLSDLSPSQVATVMLAETLPPLFLLFPAAQGAVMWALQAYSSLLDTFSTGIGIPEELVAGATLAVTAALCGALASSEFAVSEDEYQTLESAVANADRYYRLVAPEASAPGSDSNTCSKAFKAVAVSWVESRMASARAAATCAMLTTAYLGVLYNMSHDMAAPLVAAAVAGGVEYMNLHRRVVGGGGRA